MPDLLSVLDNVAEGIAKDNPDMNEAEVALATIRLNLTVLVTTLTNLGMNGDDLSNASLYGICTGLVETCEWLVAKEIAWGSMSQIESIANGEDSA